MVCQLAPAPRATPGQAANSSILARSNHHVGDEVAVSEQVNKWEQHKGTLWPRSRSACRRECPGGGFPFRPPQGSAAFPRKWLLLISGCTPLTTANGFPGLCPPARISGCSPTSAGPSCRWYLVTLNLARHLGNFSWQKR